MKNIENMVVLLVFVVGLAGCQVNVAPKEYGESLRDYTEDEMEKISEALGELWGYQSIVEVANENCQQEKSNSLINVWLERNRFSLEKINKIEKRNNSSFLKIYGEEETKKFKEGQIGIVLNGKRQSYERLISHNSREIEKICGQFIYEVNSGYWDLNVKGKSAFNIVEKYSDI